jgi:hypothetical protein
MDGPRQYSGRTRLNSGFRGKLTGASGTWHSLQFDHPYTIRPGWVIKKHTAYTYQYRGMVVRRDSVKVQKKKESRLAPRQKINPDRGLNPGPTDIMTDSDVEVCCATTALPGRWIWGFCGIYHLIVCPCSPSSPVTTPSDRSKPSSLAQMNLLPFSTS